jgi:hypothetical protein
MDARFRVAAPDSVSITLTLTDTVGEWKKLKAAIDAGSDGYGSTAAAFARRIGDAIDHASSNLCVEKWTTGYATGEVVGDGQ